MSRDYKCRYGNNCSIGRNAENLKQVCQACRFNQCILAGMKPECKLACVCLKIVPVHIPVVFLLVAVNFFLLIVRAYENVLSENAVAELVLTSHPHGKIALQQFVDVCRGHLIFCHVEVDCFITQ